MTLLNKVKSVGWEYYAKGISHLYHTPVFNRALHKNGQHRIVIYHNIATCDANSFAKQIQYYCENYKVLSLSDFLANLQEDSHTKENIIAITFDDGYKSVLEHAVPILDQYAIKPCIFIPVGFLESTKRKEYIAKNLSAPYDDDAMSWEDLRGLIAKDYEIGSHSWDHIDFGAEGVDYERELKESKSKLETELGISIDYFAFPYGKSINISEDALNKAREYYQRTFSGVKANVKGDEFLLPRTYINPSWDLKMTRCALTGCFDNKVNSTTKGNQ